MLEAVHGVFLIPFFLMLTIIVQVAGQSFFSAEYALTLARCNSKGPSCLS